jgi:hypothetical protein
MRLADALDTTTEAILGAANAPVGLEYSIVAVTCFFSEQREAVMRRSGTRG